MEHAAYVIIGGGVAGTTAAEEIRARDGKGRIVVIDEESHRFYSRIMLSKPEFFLGTIPFERIFLKDPRWYQEKQIDLWAGRTAVAVSPETRSVALRDGGRVQYDKLLIASGACAVPWDVAGAEKHGVYSLRTLDDARRIMDALPRLRRAVLVGGGFISFEMCELLKKRAVHTTLIIREAYYWENLLDRTSGTMIERFLEANGVDIKRNALVTEVLGKEKVTGVRTRTGETIPGDAVIVGIGSMCLLAFLDQSGVAMKRGVLTNAYLETTVPRIWAAGDVAVYDDLILAERVQMTNWVNAQTQGKIAGRNMTGGHEPFRLVSFYTTQALGLTIAFVGDVQVGGGKRVIERKPADGSWFVRLIVQDDELVGATLLNRTHDVAAIRTLIERDVPVPPIEGQLADPSIPLTALVANR